MLSWEEPLALLPSGSAGLHNVESDSISLFSALTLRSLPQTPKDHSDDWRSLDFWGTPGQGETFWETVPVHTLLILALQPPADRAEQWEDLFLVQELALLLLNRKERQHIPGASVFFSLKLYQKRSPCKVYWAPKSLILQLKDAAKWSFDSLGLVWFAFHLAYICGSRHQTQETPTHPEPYPRTPSIFHFTNSQCCCHSFENMLRTTGLYWQQFSSETPAPAPPANTEWTLNMEIFCGHSGVGLLLTSSWCSRNRYQRSCSAQDAPHYGAL